MQYQLGTDLEQICELQIDGHLFEAFCNSLRTRPMLEGSQSRHEDVILLNQCHCNDAGLRVMVHSLVHPVLNVALQFHLVSLFAWCGKKCEPQSFKIASHRRNDPIFASGIEAWPGRLGRGASRFRKSSKRVESGRQICFYMFLPFVQENAPDLVTERTLLSLHPLQGSARSAGAWLAR